eukprot:1149118-Pelagomonas_calceolata.AAC.4
MGKRCRCQEHWVPIAEVVLNMSCQALGEDACTNTALRLCCCYVQFQLSGPVRSLFHVGHGRRRLTLILENVHIIILGRL